MTDELVWALAMAIGTAIFLPYWIVFRRRLERDRLRRAEATRLGIDRPMAQYPFVDVLKCIGCGACTSACPEGDVLGIVGGTAVVVNGLRCVGHGRCETACPVEAIEVGMGDLKGRTDVPILTESLETTVPGIYVVGELGGLALVRNAASQGRQVVEEIAAWLTNDSSSRDSRVLDVVIVGAGPAGLSAALTAHSLGLTYLVLEKESDLGGSLLHYPRRKMVLTQELELPPWGSLRQEEYQKEELLDIFSTMVEEIGLEIRYRQEVHHADRVNDQIQISTSDRSYAARNLVLALGRRGTPRKLGVPGEETSKVMYRLIDAQDYRDKKILVVGGGDSAAEAAIGLSRQPGNLVTLSYRKEKLVRLKQKNLRTIQDLLASENIQGRLPSTVKRIDSHSVTLTADDQREIEIDNDFVFIFAGGVPPFATLKGMGIDFGGVESVS